MKNQPLEEKVNKFLTWESARIDEYVKDLDCPPPVKFIHHMPQWFKDLKTDLKKYINVDFRDNTTARMCKGFKEIAATTYTCPLPFDYKGGENSISRTFFMTEQLYGTKWNEKDSEGEKIWNIVCFAFPWRAKMSKGLTLQTGPNPLLWDENIHTFTGIMPPNNSFNIEKNGFGNLFSWEITPDTNKFNYANLEIVVAYKTGTVIKKNSILFNATIIKTNE